MYKSKIKTRRKRQRMIKKVVHCAGALLVATILAVPAYDYYKLTTREVELLDDFVNIKNQAGVSKLIANEHYVENRDADIELLEKQVVSSSAFTLDEDFISLVDTFPLDIVNCESTSYSVKHTFGDTLLYSNCSEVSNTTGALHVNHVSQNYKLDTYKVSNSEQYHSLSTDEDCSSWIKLPNYSRFEHHVFFDDHIRYPLYQKAMQDVLIELIDRDMYICEGSVETDGNFDVIGNLGSTTGIMGKSVSTIVEALKVENTYTIKITYTYTDLPDEVIVYEVKLLDTPVEVPDQVKENTMQYKTFTAIYNKIKER